VVIIPVTRAKTDNIVGRVGSQPDSESIGLGCVKIPPDRKSVRSGDNICKTDPGVDRATNSRNSIEQQLGRVGMRLIKVPVDSDSSWNWDPTRPADITGTDRPGGKYSIEIINSY